MNVVDFALLVSFRHWDAGVNADMLKWRDGFPVYGIVLVWYCMETSLSVYGYFEIWCRTFMFSVLAVFTVASNRSGLACSQASVTCKLNLRLQRLVQIDFGNRSNWMGLLPALAKFSTKHLVANKFWKKIANSNNQTFCPFASFPCSPTFLQRSGLIFTFKKICAVPFHF